MTARSKHLAVLMGEAAAVVTIQYVMAARAQGPHDEEVLVRPRHVWLYAVAGEVVTFLIDELIRQRRRAEFALDRVAATNSMPSAQLGDRMRLPRQHSQSNPAVLPGT